MLYNASVETKYLVSHRIISLINGRNIIFELLLPTIPRQYHAMWITGHVVILGSITHFFLISELMPDNIYIYIYIYINTWVIVNSDFLVTSEMIRQWFSRVTKSQVKNHWPITEKPVTKKSIIHGNDCIILNLTRYFMSRTHSFIKINHRQSVPQLSPRTVFSEYCVVTTVDLWRHVNVRY